MDRSMCGYDTNTRLAQEEHRACALMYPALTVASPRLRAKDYKE